MMKKVLYLRLLLVIFALMASFPMLAHDIEVKNADGVTIYYGWRNDSELYVTYRGDNWSDGRLCYSGIVVIPESVKYGGNTYSVTCIGSGAFFGNGLTSVTIPNSVTTINSSAFMDCLGLKSVTIPISVTHIDDGAFIACDNLTSIVSEIKNPFRIGGAFGSSKATLTVPAGTKSLYQSTAGWNEFQNIVEASEGGDIGEVFESGGINYIVGENNTVSVTSDEVKYSGDVVIPEQVKYNGETYTVTSIGGQRSFGSKVTSVTIPNSVTELYDESFRGFYGIIHITDLEAWCKIIVHNETFSYYNGYETTNYYHRLFLNGKEITDLVIPSGVTSIGQYTFSCCTSITSVTIPNSVNSIGSGAFSQCSGLTSVTIPNSVTSIGWSAFSGCSGLTSVTIPNSVTSIESWAFMNCTSLTSITIPNSVTSIGGGTFSGCSGLTSVTIPNSVTSIESWAFYNCSGLTSVTIPNSVTSIGREAFSGTAWYNNQPDGLIYAGKVAYKYKGTMPDNTSITIKDGTLGIAGSAFYGCSGLTSVTIPISVTSIGSYAFDGCKGLTTIVSEMEKPFEIYSSTFSDDTYIVAELIVPYGTKTAYQNTEGWNKFTMITEAADKDEASFTIDGVTYEGSKSAMTVVVKAVDTKQMSVDIPVSVSYDGVTYQVIGMDDDAFKGCDLGALIWNVEAALPNNAFSNASIGSNFLLYVKQASFAPSSIKNVIANGTASSIVLSDDGGPFYCPQAFTARSISYTHNYSMETGGNGKGWETIALPFDVQKIVHNTRGEIVPFAGYSSASNQKPFWLGNMSASGFKRASSIQANEPYIIAMPNNSKYNNDYNLAGDVTFSADNVQVAKTPTFNGLFLPAFATVAKSSSVYALNVNNRNVRYSGSYDAGSRFIANLRDVRPFEAYMTGISSTRGIIEISFDDGTTDMFDILLPTDESQEITIHTLSGQQITRITQRDFDAVWQQLPKGVYIVNDKKRIK